MSAVEQKLNYLVHGFISTLIESLKLQDKYPSELNVFIIKFLGNIWMRFDLFNKKYKECVRNDGTLIIKQPSVSSKMFSILSSNAFKQGDIGEFKIKCINPDRDSIGITSNKGIILDECLNKYHTYSRFVGGVRGRKPLYYYRVDGSFNETGGATVISQRPPGCIAGDIVTVKVDCVKWTVSFLKNNKVMGRGVG